jgi:hypothetical protein
MTSRVQVGRKYAFVVPAALRLLTTIKQHARGHGNVFADL